MSAVKTYICNLLHTPVIRKSTSIFKEDAKHVTADYSSPLDAREWRRPSRRLSPSGETCQFHG